MRGFWRRRGRFSAADLEDRVRIGVAAHIGGLDGDWRRAWLLTSAGAVAGLLEGKDAPVGLTVTVAAEDGATVVWSISPGDVKPTATVMLPVAGEDGCVALGPVDVPDTAEELLGEDG